MLRMQQIVAIGLLSFAASPARAADTKVSETAWIDDLGGTVTRNAQGRVNGVDLRGSWVGDSDLRRLNQFPDLTTLNLSLTRVTDQGMQEIKGLRGIVDFNAAYAEYLTDEGIAVIKDWKKLTRLNLHGIKVSDSTLEHISGIATLESLNVGSTMLTDVALERLTTLPKLKELTIGGNELGDSGLQALRQMQSLTYLDLSGRQGTDKNVWTIAMSETGLDAVLTLKELRELRFACTMAAVGIEGAKFAEVSVLNLTPKWVEKMKALPKLEKLKLQGCGRVDDTVVQSLTAMPNLKEVDLKGTSVTDKGIAALRAAKPNITVYSGAWEAKAAGFRNN